MSAITNLNESWADHTFAEIEAFIKQQITEIEEMLQPENE